MRVQRIGSVGVSMRKKNVKQGGAVKVVGENGAVKVGGETVVDRNGVTRYRNATGRVGRVVVSDDAKKSAIDAARIGIPTEKIAILLGFYGNDTGWARWLAQEPGFATALAQSRVAGEVAMQHTVLSGSDGWQGSAWTLERRHGCVARQQLEHSGPGGKSLTIAHQVLAVVNPAERA